MSISRAEVRGYFHGDVDLGTSPSADYVVTHAARQRQRGKNPSVNYRGHTNPRKSLVAAEADIAARDSDDDYVAAFSGRVALIRVWSKRQEEIAKRYADLLMRDCNATGATIQNLTEHVVQLRDKGELGADEALPVPTPLNYRIIPGAVETMLPI